MPAIEFDEFYKKYKTSAFTSARRYLGDYDSAMDVVQDVFIKINSMLGRFDKIDDAGKYLIRMIVNKSIDELRKRKKVVTLENPELIVAKSVDFTEEKDEIDFLLSFLQEEQKIVLVMREFTGYSVKETAELLNIDEGTVKSRLSRAKVKLREIYIKKEM